MVLNKKETVSVIKQLSIIWKRRSEELTESQRAKKNAMLRKLNFIQKFYIYLTMLLAFLYIAVPLVNIIIDKALGKECKLVLPLNCKYPFDPYQSYVLYLVVYAFEGYSIFNFIFPYIATEFLLVVLCSHLVTEFSLLREDLLHVMISNNENNDVSIEECDKKISIKDFVKRHQELIELSKRVDSIFNKINLVVFLFAVIIMCFFSFAGRVAHSSVDMFVNYSALVSFSMPLCMLCYYSEMLREESTGIADSSYNHLWYKGNIKYQKSILIIIMRSNIPCTLTLATYSPVMLSTFSKVISTTWSYFSLMNKVYEENY